jgi:hypothetical protein
VPQVRTVFICRAREDRDDVHRLVQQLHELTPWWHVVEDVPVQDDWLPRAKAVIAEADVFLFVASAAGVRSTGCGDELAFLAQEHASKPKVRVDRARAVPGLAARWPWETRVVDGSAGLDGDVAVQVLATLAELVED